MTDQSTTDLEQPFISHLMELRDRLLRMVLVVLVIFLALFPFGNDIYRFIAEPLMAVLPEGTSMIATQVASPFLTPFKLSLVSAVFAAMPYILYQFWGFVAPGLYQHERRMAMPLLVSSIALFYLGMLFAFYVVFPLVFSFLTGMAPEGVAVMTDITAYLDFVLTLFFAFGIAFEVPIATIILVWMGMTTPENLAGKRPYVIVGAFVIGMLLTPPDVISQTLLAFPMWVLFELGIIFSRFFVRKPEDEEEEQEASPAGDPPGDPVEQNAGQQEPEEHQPTSAMEARAEEFKALTEEEMEAELDRIEEEEASWYDEEAGSAETGAEPEGGNPVDDKIERANALREEMDPDAARRLLYEVLVEGDEDQVRVARNILAQLDD